LSLGASDCEYDQGRHQKAWQATDPKDPTPTLK